MNNFLCVDTSGKYLSVLLYANGTRYKRFIFDCAMRHSVVMMDEIDRAFSEARIMPNDCDFFCAVTGPGSFTGIRIGLSTVKGLCLALQKKSLAITSFDALAYAVKGEKLLTLIDAGHANFYACAYDEEKNIVHPPVFIDREEVNRLIDEGFVPVASEALFEGCKSVCPADGLFDAVQKKQDEATFDLKALSALYLRKSSAEEKLS